MSTATPRPGQAAASPGAFIVFDVNETLLDFTVLDPVFARIFGNPRVNREWFNQVVLYMEALTLSGAYVDSGAVGAAVLHMLADARGRRVQPSDLDEIKRLSSAMPTYPDVPAALARLRQAGFRLTTLSNNPSAGVDVQLTHAGLRPFFEQLHSIDDKVKRYKPARESYLALADTLGVPPGRLWLVSCHAFDTLGAAAAGYRTALILRPDNAPVALGKAPDVIGIELGAIAERIIAAGAPSDVK